MVYNIEIEILTEAMDYFEEVDSTWSLLLSTQTLRAGLECEKHFFKKTVNPVQNRSWNGPFFKYTHNKEAPYS
jgi:hypothetical protein